MAEKRISELDAATTPDGTEVVPIVQSSVTVKATINQLLRLGSATQAWDQALDDISGLAVTDGNVIVGNGTNWVAESGATARASLGAAASGANTDITSVTLGNTGLTVGASVPFSDAAGTLTLQNVDALDATTEATIEAAIDTLANLTSIQGRTVTLADAGANAIFGWDDTAGAYENLSAAEATAVLNAFTGDSGAGGVKGLVPAPAAGDAAASKFLKADGTWAAPSGAGDVTGPASSVDGEIALFDGVTGKTLKRASTTGLLKGTSGVLSAASAGTDYYAPGSTDVAIADGGTGASTAAGARTNLGLAIGTDVQAYDADLTTWAGLTPSANAQSLVTAANYAAMRALLDLEAGTDFYSIAAADAAFQPLDADLTSWAGVTRAAGFDTFAATPSSSNLASLVTDETGSGALVFGTGPTFSSTVAATHAATFKNTSDGASVAGIRIEGDRATMAANDEVYASFYLSDGAGTQTEFARISAIATDVTNTSEDGAIDFGVMTAGTLTDHVRLDTTTWGPITNDTHALGSGAVAWSDLFLASGGVVNFNNGDVTITHSADTLTFGGAASGYFFDVGVTVRSGTDGYSTQTPGSAANSGYLAFHKPDGTRLGFLGFSAGDMLYTAENSATHKFTGGNIVPASNDGVALGTAALSFSDLFLASGAVVNFNNGDVTITHSANTLTFGGATSYVFDAGIKFPATQVASADANTLDDYEEGTFTPGLTFGGGSTSMTFSTQIGRYQKVGNRVNIHVRIILSAKGSSTGNAVVTGLPFTGAAGVNPPCDMYLSVSASMSGQHLQPLISGTTVLLRYLNTTSSANMTDANFTNTTDVGLATTYEADA